uniref:ATP cone domain-containing protein n=1 Tax=Anaerococcus mediterraneensis TaxID=1870984 RepID=UPI0009F810BE|nr:ATP cone domain-containing protein [Anaerococcus mediterraneensis]
MTEKILDLVEDFLKKHEIADVDLQKMVENLPVDQIMAMLAGKDRYVVKKSGRLEKYNEEKIGRSINNAADRSEMPLNSSDLAMILKEVSKKLFDDTGNNNIHKTSEIKDVVKEVLKSSGFSKIFDSYSSYVKDQN